MPVHGGRDSKGPFYQYGGQKKYHYNANSEKSRKRAKRKAHMQESAIEHEQKRRGKKTD